MLNARYPERLVIKLKQGTKSILEKEAKNRGFSSISTMVRAALKYSLENSDFVNKK